MAKQKALQKISIVFEETGEEGTDSRGKKGSRLVVYLDGFTRNIDHVNEKDLSPAEFWAHRCFCIIADVIKKAGAFETEIQRPDPGIKQ